MLLFAGNDDDDPTNVLLELLLFSAGGGVKESSGKFSMNLDLLTFLDSTRAGFEGVVWTRRAILDGSVLAGNDDDNLPNVMHELLSPSPRKAGGGGVDEYSEKFSMNRNVRLFTLLVFARAGSVGAV